MAEDRLRSGPLIAATGAAVLAISVFLPWYGLSLTSSGAASARQALDSVAQQFGNTAFQAEANQVGEQFNAYTGQQLATLSAHQALKYVSVILLILAAIAFVAALLRLAGTSESVQAGGDPTAFVGIVATVLVVLRMVDRPAPQQSVFSLSLTWGIWLALLSAVAILAGGLSRTGGDRPAESPDKAWEKLSGWTPGG